MLSIVIINYFKNVNLLSNDSKKFLNIFVKKYFDYCSMKKIQYSLYKTDDLILYSSYLKTIMPFIKEYDFIKYKDCKKFILSSIELNSLLYYSLSDTLLKTDCDIIAFGALYNKSIFITNTQCHNNKEVINAVIKNHGLDTLYNKKNKLNFFHIAASALNIEYTSDYINYTFLKYNKKDINKTKNDFIECINDIQNTNITVIFINITTASGNFETFYNEMNNIIDKTKNKYHIKIINIFTNYTQLLKNNSNFYKISNVKLSNTFYDYRQYSYTPETSDNIYLLRFLHKGSCKKHENMLAVHWINWIINSPIFAKDHHFQLTGTCWLNGSINSLILTSEIKNELYDQYDIYVKKRKKIGNFPLSYNEMQNEEFITSNAIKDIFYSIIGKLKKNIKFSYNDNYMQILGAYIKSMVPEYINNFNKLQSNFTEPVYKLCKATDDNLFKNKICESSNKSNIDTLNEICNYTILKKNICTIKNPTNDEKKGFIYGDSGKISAVIYILNTIFNTRIISFEHRNEIKLKYINLLITDTKLNDDTYKLGASYLCSPRHAICGIINNNIEYIYDSQSNITVKQEWSNLTYAKFNLLENYKNKFIEKKNSTDIDFHYRLIFFIYIKKII